MEPCFSIPTSPGGSSSPNTNAKRNSPGGHPPTPGRRPPGDTGFDAAAREPDMFSVFCPRHGRWVLLGPSDILALEPAPDGGLAIGYRCSCGYEGRWPAAPGEDAGEDGWKDRMAG